MSQGDREAPVRFLRSAYGPEDWIAVFLKSSDSCHTTQRVGPVSLIATPRFQAWLRWRNLTRSNVYVSLNAVVPDQRTRRREAIAVIRHIFLDIDRDGAQTLATIANRRDLPTPSYVVHSSTDRLHVLWRASGFTIDGAERLQRLLAQELGTDQAATPSTQMTRLPGFVNHRRHQHLVTIEYIDISRSYTPADFPKAAVTRGHAGPVRPTFHMQSDVEVLTRARRYVTALPPAVMGQHGDLHTFRVCCRLVRGFALSDAEAFELLLDWNRQCEPPWSERELLDKLRRARRYGREPIGGLLRPTGRVRTNLRVESDSAPEVM
jgi:hypothetical protein